MTTCLLITTCDRTNLLRVSLDRLVSLTLPDEVLVVDDGGNDQCENVVLTYGGRLPVRYLYLDNQGDTLCSKARNAGIWATDCDVIVTSEPELIFETDVLAQMLELHAEHPNHVISAGTVHHRQQGGATQTCYGWVAPFTALYERQWLLDIGGWDEAFPSPWGWEDTDLLTRLRWAGHGQLIPQEIEVTHQWHHPRWCDQTANEAHFRAKTPEADLVANKGA